MKLVIVESPNKCAKIKSFLGSEYNVVASVGHIREIPKQGLNVDIKGGFEPTYEISKGKKDVVKKIKELAKEAEKIYLASDPDREGSAIAFSIYETLDNQCKKKCVRIMFNEITKGAVLKAVQETSSIDSHMPLIQAAKARQVLDRLIGYKASPMVWYAVAKGTSAGRVQSIALKLICERQKEIDKFKPEDFWFVDLLLKCKNGEFWGRTVTKDKDNKFLQEKIAQDALIELKKASFHIDKIEKSETKKNPYPPFDTASLQMTCSSVFGWSASKTQVLAQSLYEQGLVTYIRTDSYTISEEALKEVRDMIKANLSDVYLPTKPNAYSKKSGASAQEAHECIRPTHLDNKGDNVEDNDEKKMYRLIRDRFIACQMTPMVTDNVTYRVKASSGHNVMAKGQTIKFDGWFKVYTYIKSEEELLPPAIENEKLDLKDSKCIKGTTKPPARYNDGSLIKRMEAEGVGRPSTWPAIIKNLEAKGYYIREKKAFLATELGMRVCDFLVPAFGDSFMDVKYTAGLEDDLDDIAKGKKTYLEVVQKVYDMLKSKIKDAKENGETKQEKTMGVKCSVCKEGEVVEKFSKFGTFYSCNKYPDCKTVYTKAEDGTFTVKAKKDVKYIDKTCDVCGSKLREINGQYGIFYGCSAYPKCKSVYVKDENGQIVKKEKSGGYKTYKSKKTANSVEDED